MFPLKTKIRISSTAKLIIIHDCEFFGFVYHDEPNINEFLNKLIPNSVKLRKERRNILQDKIKEYEKSNPEMIENAINYFVDEVYFGNNEFSNLDEYIWIRPKKENLYCFDEIYDSELKIMSTTISNYLRLLINEYCNLALFNREKILFQNELLKLNNSIISNKIVGFRYKGETYKIFFYVYMRNLLFNECGRIIGYDVKNKTIRSFLLSEIKIYLLHIKSVKLLVHY